MGSSSKAWTRGVALAAFGALACTPEHVVLVHGAFMGGWVWEPVAQQLRDLGEDVTVVELPSHGSDQTPLTAATLDAYVQRLEQEVGNGPPVMLVGHSMAGMVISQYAERHPQRVKRLVYFAALLPQSGQSLLDLSLADPGSLAGTNAVFNMQTGLASLPSGMLQQIFCEECSPTEAAEIRTNYRDEPILPMATQVTLTPRNFGRVPKWYLYTEWDRAVSHDLQEQMTAGVELIGSELLHTSHTPQLSAPDLVVSAIERAMRTPAPH